MYLIINGNKHSVSRRIVTSDTIKYLTVDPQPETISGTIQMFRDDGFLMSEDNAERFERKFCTGTLLTLTNKPEPQPVVPTIEEVRAQCLASISESCRQTIIGGVDVTLSDGTIEHFSLEETDQINLTTAYNAVLNGAAGYPYHADGQLCKLYSADDITAIGNAATSHKLYHLTYCNHLLTWARGAETVEELNGIYYGAELPEVLSANMEAVLNAASQ